MANKIDTLLTNGRIYTMREEGQWVEAVGIHEGRILFAGSTAACAACPAERIIDLKGKTVLPIFPCTDLHWIENRLGKERLSVYEAICLFTKNIAYMTGDEDVLGTIEAGKYADLTVLSADPFRMEPDRLKNLAVDMTFVAGEVVYESCSF